MICKNQNQPWLNHPRSTTFYFEMYPASQSKRYMEKILGDRLLNKAVEELLKYCNKKDTNFKIIRKGKPKVVSDFPISISLSHTLGLVCAAASLKMVGVDCETIQSFSPQLLDKISSKQEIENLNLKSDESFTQLWCAKEAVSKALGIGFKINPKNIIISIEKQKKEMCYAVIEEIDKMFNIYFNKINENVVALAELR